MANIKAALDQQVTRGESLLQIVILLVAIIGITQLTSILAAEPKTSDATNSTTSIGEVGKTGAAGIPGLAGAAGQDGKPGLNGSNGARGLTGLNGQAGAQGLTGATGNAGNPGGFTASYGQLVVTTDIFHLEEPDEWLSIPFGEIGPASNMAVELATPSSPSAITTQQDGVYQVSISVHFSAEEADEFVFTPTNYRLGIKVNNGAVKTVATTYANQAGEYLLNYSEIANLSAGDAVQFYIASSDTSFRPFANLVRLESGNAYVMQISD